MASRQSIVITGGGRGLGRASALAFARRGWRVALFSRTGEELERVKDEIGSLGGTALACPGDITLEEDLKRLRSLVLDQLGFVDLLLNNAAVIGPPRFLEDAGQDAWNRVLNVNLNGPAMLIRTFLPMMLERRKGSVISITSGLASMPFPRFCAYAASKAGIEQMTRSLSTEYASHGLRFNAVDPGVMDTSMQERLRSLPPEVMGEVGERFSGLKERGQLRDPGEVAELLLLLESGRGRTINGRILSVADLSGMLA
jgi:3-oxoacyl-[acyl-carrier protein] reductase